MINRVIWIVIDSVGIGELPDAKAYGDEGSNTLENIYKKIENFKLTNLERLGIGDIDGVKAISKNNNPLGAYGKAIEKSPGKDTTTGHWEMTGVIIEKPFPVFLQGFPKELMKTFEEQIGRGTLGNYKASGTEIIQELGDLHYETGKPIIYTSADSVFQIAAHEEIIPLNELYEICKKARALLKGEYGVGRVIARPFIGEKGSSYTRTSNRRDFSIKPIKKTVLDLIKESGYRTMGVGKIEDIFDGQGLTDTIHIKNNMDGVDKTLDFMKINKEGLIFTNLVDFDMKFGHRNNVEGYANALIEFDKRIPEIIESMNSEDVLIINSDHGCDPTTKSTDHSREYIPILVYGKIIKPVNIGIRSTFADIGATICDMLKVKKPEEGTSFYNEIV